MMNSAPDATMCFRIVVSTVAPRLSTLDTNRYSLPSASSRSSSPDRASDAKMSPCPGGYHCDFGAYII